MRHLRKGESVGGIGTLSPGCRRNVSQHRGEEKEESVGENAEVTEVPEILAEHEIDLHEYRPVVNSIRKRPEAWLHSI
ncbi:unnamed protein product [Linum tenue]|uniref:Uncharacterized protein n=1 Tax=Linum tenue TaxID=586396 RepID=A0AAV0NZY4_9ROSI|nr:unnamed protein product [Linum tenue]